MTCVCRLSVLLGIQAGQPILGKQLKVEGFMVGRWNEEWPVAFKELDRWIQEVGKTLFNSSCITYIRTY